MTDFKEFVTLAANFPYEAKQDEGFGSDIECCGYLIGQTGFIGRVATTWEVDSSTSHF